MLNKVLLLFSVMHAINVMSERAKNNAPDDAARDWPTVGTTI